MAKKKQALPRIKTRSVYNREADALETRFYKLEGGRWKKTDEKERKQYIKENRDGLQINQLSKEDSIYLKRVEAGEKRIKEAVRIEGKIVNKSFFDNPNNPIQFQQLANERGITVQQLFNEDPEIYAEAVAAYNSTEGLAMEYHSDIILNRIDTFGGKIQINGKTVSKLNAMHRVDEIDKIIKRKYSNFTNDFTVLYQRGYTIMNIQLPDEKQIDEAAEKEELQDFGVNVIGSDTEEIKLQRDIKKWEENNIAPDRFNYEVHIKVKKGKRIISKTEKVSARSQIEAKSIVSKKISGAITGVDRIAKTKHKKKKGK